LEVVVATVVPGSTSLFDAAARFQLSTDRHRTFSPQWPVDRRPTKNRGNRAKFANLAIQH